MDGFTQIDLSALPAPDVIETLDFEAIVAEMRDYLVGIFPAIAGVIDLESEPARKLIEVFAWRETLLRARINSAARATMLAYADGADLDHIGATFSVQRLTITPENTAVSPPVPAVMESDADFRARIQLSFEGYSTAGPVGAYLFHAISASGDVLDASVTSPDPGEVLVTVLARDGDGTADAGLLALVADAVNADDVRPLCDDVSVQSAEIVDYAITATLYFLPGPDRGTIIDAAEAAAGDYAEAQRRVGRDIARSGIFAALHQPGVAKVVLASPAADIAISDVQAGYCTGITITDGGVL